MLSRKCSITLMLGLTRAAQAGNPSPPSPASTRSITSSCSIWRIAASTIYGLFGCRGIAEAANAPLSRQRRQVHDKLPRSRMPTEAGGCRYALPDSLPNKPFR